MFLIYLQLTLVKKKVYWSQFVVNNVIDKPKLSIYKTTKPSVTLKTQETQNSGFEKNKKIKIIF